MADKKRPSGAQNRKRKAEKAKLLAEQTGSFLKYLRRANEQQICHQDIETREAECSNPFTNDFDPKADIQIRGNEESEKGENVDAALLDVDYGDPANWPSYCDDNYRLLLVQNGPHQIVTHDFPKDAQKRRFSPTYYKRILPNGEHVYRSWLIYSVTKDAAFCFCCKLFNKKSMSTLQEPGSKDWKNIGAILSSHERNTYHLENYQAWKELELRLSKNATIDDFNQQKIKEEAHYWRQILERLIALVRVLGTQNLAFRGTREKLYSNTNGNFLKFIEYLALFDPLMNEHLRRIKNQETLVHYLGKETQNELIQILAGAIKKKILTSVKLAKYYSIILDCTPDISHVEQMTMIIRFVNVGKPLNGEVPQVSTSNSEITIKEHFLGFVPLEKTTGSFMTETLIEQLEQMDLPIENLRGQGYDNGSNMKGKENGVQKRVLDINPRAFFVPCNAHSLNLVVNDASKCCLEATNFFSLVQQIYNYFSASTHRWQVLSNHLVNFTVKPLSDTRWESRIDALKPLRYHLGDIYDALLEIFDDPRLNNSSGNISRIEAKALADAICKFKFMVSLVTWYNILFEVNIASKMLQAMDADLNSATNQLKITKSYLLKSRSDEGFEQVLVDAIEVAKELEIEPKFDAEQVRKRRQKRHFQYEVPDETPQDPKEKYKVGFYYPVLDMAIQSITERFQQMEQHNNLFGFLYDIYNIKSKSASEILTDCRNFEKSFTHNSHKDIDANDLCNEVQALARRLPKSMPPAQVLSFIVQQKLVDCLPNIFVALRLLLTLPVSVASGERSFSKLKQIKTYLRSTMSQNRLVDLATISIECDQAWTLDLKELIENFARRKARKNKF